MKRLLPAEVSVFFKKKFIKYEKLKKGICFNMDTRAGLVRIFQVKKQTVLQKETSLQKQKIDEFLVSFLK